MSSSIKNDSIVYYRGFNYFVFVLSGLLFFPNAKIGGDPSQPEGQQQKSKSFFIRYWYIILPVLIITLLGGGEEPAGPKSSAGGVPSSSTTTGNVAKSEAPDTSGVPKRRGKRD